MPFPSKLDPQTLDELIELIKLGTPRSDALRAKGIDAGTERRWRQRGAERPGSIYGTWRARLEQAEAEFTTIHVANINRAARLPTTTTTTVTKHEARPGPEGVELVVTEKTIHEVVKPPDPKYSTWLLERRNPRFQSRQAIEATVEHLPPDLLNRSMAELLRVVKGDDGPSLLRDEDQEARVLIGAEVDRPR